MAGTALTALPADGYQSVWSWQKSVEVVNPNYNEQVNDPDPDDGVTPWADSPVIYKDRAAPWTGPAIASNLVILVPALIVILAGVAGLVLASALGVRSDRFVR